MPNEIEILHNLVNIRDTVKRKKKDKKIITTNTSHKCTMKQRDAIGGNTSMSTKKEYIATRERKNSRKGVLRYYDHF